MSVCPAQVCQKYSIILSTSYKYSNILFTFEHHREPRVQTNVRVGIIAAQNVTDVSVIVAVSCAYAVVLVCFNKNYNNNLNETIKF